MNELERAILLSVHPRFAEAILAGSKSVEVRRQRVAVPSGTPVLLDATAPPMALVGMARIAAVQLGPLARSGPPIVPGRGSAAASLTST